MVLQQSNPWQNRVHSDEGVNNTTNLSHLSSDDTLLILDRMRDLTTRTLYLEARLRKEHLERRMVYHTSIPDGTATATGNNGYLRNSSRVNVGSNGVYRTGGVNSNDSDGGVNRSGGNEVYGNRKDNYNMLYNEENRLHSYHSGVNVCGGGGVSSGVGGSGVDVGGSGGYNNNEQGVVISRGDAPILLEMKQTNETLKWRLLQRQKALITTQGTLKNMQSKIKNMENVLQQVENERNNERLEVSYIYGSKCCKEVCV